MSTSLQGPHPQSLFCAVFMPLPRHPGVQFCVALFGQRPSKVLVAKDIKQKETKKQNQKAIVFRTWRNEFGSNKAQTLKV